jgi:hypothetical protein
MIDTTFGRSIAQKYSTYGGWRKQLGSTTYYSLRLIFGTSFDLSLKT